MALTAYFGLLEIGQSRNSGETLVHIRCPLGATGSIVGPDRQKSTACRVVGIAGSDEKCQWIKDDLGFDARHQLQTPRLGSSSSLPATPNGIDIDF